MLRQSKWIGWNPFETASLSLLNSALPILSTCPSFVGNARTADLSISLLVAATAKSLQSCPTLCDPTDGSTLGSAIRGILQAKTLEWVAISFSNAWKWKVKVRLLSHVLLLAAPWTAAYQAPPSMGFSRQEYWSGSPVSSPALWVSPCKYLVLIFSLSPLSFFLLLPFNQRKNSQYIANKETNIAKGSKRQTLGPFLLKWGLYIPFALYSPSCLSCLVCPKSWPPSYPLHLTANKQKT